MLPLYVLVSSVLFANSGAANAQAMYRCGNTFSERSCGPDAKVLVSPRAAQVPDTPAFSAIRELPLDVPPSAEQVAANIATCERQTRAAMKDPESARIKSISRAGPALQRYQGRSLYGVSYHMNVNAKNSYGGYTGEKLWNCVFSIDEKTWLYSQEIAPW